MKFKKGQILRLAENRGLVAKKDAKAKVVEDCGEEDRFVNIIWIDDLSKKGGRYQSDGLYYPHQFELASEDIQRILE